VTIRGAMTDWRYRNLGWGLLTATLLAGVLLVMTLGSTDAWKYALAIIGAALFVVSGVSSGSTRRPSRRN
jgi:hypothetical protein